MSKIKRLGTITVRDHEEARRKCPEWYLNRESSKTAFDNPKHVHLRGPANDAHKVGYYAFEYPDGKLHLYEGNRRLNAYGAGIERDNPYLKGLFDEPIEVYIYGFENKADFSEDECIAWYNATVNNKASAKDSKDDISTARKRAGVSKPHPWVDSKICQQVPMTCGYKYVNTFVNEHYELPVGRGNVNTLSGANIKQRAVEHWKNELNEVSEDFTLWRVEDNFKVNQVLNAGASAAILVSYRWWGEDCKEIWKNHLTNMDGSICKAMRSTGNNPETDVCKRILQYIGAKVN